MKFKVGDKVRISPSVDELLFKDQCNYIGIITCRIKGSMYDWGVKFKESTDGILNFDDNELLRAVELTPEADNVFGEIVDDI